MEGCGSGQFRRLGRKNLQSLIERSVSITVNAPIRGISGGVVMSAYARLSEEAKRNVGEPYLMCMRYLLETTAERARMFLGESGEKIAYVFEKSPKWQTKIHELWAELEEHFKETFRMGTIAFVDKGEFRGNEAADRLAYEVRSHMLDRSTSRPMWNRLIENRERYRGRYVDDDGISGLIADLNNKRNLGS
jgi:hypothetical protein